MALCVKDLPSRGDSTCTGPEAGSCSALAGREAESGSEVAHVHCWLTTCPLACVGTRACLPAPCSVLGGARSRGGFATAYSFMC